MDIAISMLAKGFILHCWRAEGGEAGPATVLAIQVNLFVDAAVLYGMLARMTESAVRLCV